MSTRCGLRPSRVVRFRSVARSLLPRGTCLRRQEVARLDLVDLRTNAKAPRFGRCGVLAVRHGKAARGGPPQRRTVLLVPEIDWVMPVNEHWLREIRPTLRPGRHPALWITERRGRVSLRSGNAAFTAARDAASLDSALDLHCLRHSYVTHLIEFGYPVKFVQDQVGHKHASTTSIYTSVSDEFRNELLQQSLQGRLGRMWGRSAVIKKMGYDWHLRQPHPGGSGRCCSACRSRLRALPCARCGVLGAPRRAAP